VKIPIINVVEPHEIATQFGMSAGGLASSAFIAGPVLLKQIERVTGQCKFDVIHFNNGMHGWQHSDNVHFNDQGIALQADQVAAQIEKRLN